MDISFPSVVVLLHTLGILQMDSVPPEGKAWDVRLFLDSGILQLMLTRTAIEALHYRVVYHVYSMDICSLSVLRT